MTFTSLQHKIDVLGNPARFLRDVPVGAYQYPVQSQFSNWRDEQRSWRETVGLLDQSLHMTDLYIEGPDTIRLLSEVGVNSFKNYGRNKGKQLICCNHDGFLIGDMVLSGLEDDKVNVVGRPPVANWIRYVAQSGDYDVQLELDQRAVANPQPRKTFRYELQGPNAWALLDRLNGGNLEKPKFFQMGEITIAGHRLRALAHAFAGAPGLEFWGPAELGPEVKATIVEAGDEYGLKLVGGRAYGTCAAEAGWIPSPLPAIYSGDAMRGYREWLAGDGFEANGSIGGSFVSDDITDYYLTPWDVDYGRLIKFDHDFIGREALERMATRPHRRKVTLEWNADDVLAVERSILTGEAPGKYMETPCAHYAAHPYDCVMISDRMVGLSTYPTYLSVDHQWISLAMIDEADAQIGDMVTVIWGEPDGASRKPGVEPHVQKEIRARIVPWPYLEAARTMRPHTASA
ncbi:glycine cleavage system aminomethyltransferase T [Novosphingobium capsulatum]|uniref:Glycine cleavage system aminomethyltransferase T n=1 Tax=Novosphingobium capsulatum TaxID=13688 RepID=A0ABU1MTA2_9SPHN|nr:aminomethyl transferase family protein [Novosphingobium capsulatum]MDR6513097.1 glycine cleavage system aminomethyltransferase T [Novosphingobium capsulatum]